MTFFLIHLTQILYHKFMEKSGQKIFSFSLLLVSLCLNGKKKYKTVISTWKKIIVSSMFK